MIQYLNIFGGSETSGEQDKIKMFNPHIPALKMNYNVFTEFTKTFLKLEFTI